MSVNGPLMFLNLTVNIFFACCLIFPPCNAQRLKQPLNLLLGLLVWCSILYYVSLASLCWLLKEEQSVKIFVVCWVIVLYCVHNSMTSSVWLNFYYYVKIVPTQRTLQIWVKRNIKSVMYMAFLFDGTLFLFTTAVSTTDAIFQTSGLTYINNTWTDGHGIDGLHLASKVCWVINTVQILSCLCIMTFSSFSTGHYLYRHIRSVAQGGGFFSTPRVQSQIRVTISGISQGVLYFLYATFYFFDSFTYFFSPHFAFGTWVSFTVTSLYISGTTVNLSIGQAIFRQRAADVWKALKVLCGVGMVTNDVKMHSRQLTSANTVTIDVQMSV